MSKGISSSSPPGLGAENSAVQAVTRRRFLMMLGGAGALAGLGALGTAGALAAPGGMEAVRRTSRAFGTEVSLLALHPNRDTAERAAAAALAEVEQVDRVMSLYRAESQLCVLNREGALAGPHPYLVEMLRKARAVSERTAGAFDVTVQPLWDLYAGATSEGRIPDAGAVKAVLPRVDWRKVEVSDDRVRLLGEGTAVTLNGIAQGYAADRALAALRAHGVRHALLNTGEVGALGRKESGDAWVVGIRHPREADAYVSAARLDGCCLATSGDYATTFTPDHSHNHLLDPKTGRSPGDFASVTLLAPTATEADALSTAAFVLGRERGLRLIRNTPGVEALLVLKNGDVLATPGFDRAA